MMRLAGLFVLAGLIQDRPAWDAKAYPWPMFGQNPRRTQQSPYTGPKSAAKSWSYTVPGGLAINMQAVVSDRGVYFGTWGLCRKDKKLTPDTWDKMDGKYYGLGLADGKELFDPLAPAPVSAGYRHPGRAKLARDKLWVGADNEYLVSFYNGTIEGTACIDPADGTHYVGRGDGKLYAIDPARGRVKWSFATVNPEDPKDPDGGGEIIGGPVIGPGRAIYFGTWGAPSEKGDVLYETHAVYALDPSGKLKWRYPSAKARLSNPLFTPPALSLDGRTLYVATWAGDTSQPGELFAFDLTQPDSAGDDARLKWKMTLVNTARFLKPNIYVRCIAVGVDRRLYCGGLQVGLGGVGPLLFAVEDQGKHGAFVWKEAAEPQGWPSGKGQVAGGIALREESGSLLRIYFTTTHVGRSNGEGGALFAIDPKDGSVQGEFDPSRVDKGGVGGMTPPVIGADGMVYAGVRGKHRTLKAAVDGHMYAVSFEPSGGFKLVWDFPVCGQIEWGAPAIGADGGLYFGTTDTLDPTRQGLFYAPKEVPPETSPKFYGLLR